MNQDAINRRKYLITTITIFVGFLIFGFSENIKGPAIPRIQSDFNLDEIQIGTLLALNSLGYLLACSYTSWLSSKIGLKTTNILSFVFMIVAGVLIYLSPNYVTFSGSYFIMYLGNGMLEITLGVMAATIFTKNTGTMMNLSHFFYGLSSMVAPIMATKLMGASFQFTEGALGWRGMYLVVLSLSVIPIIPAMFSSFRKSSEEEGAEKISMWLFLKDRTAWLIIFILSFGVTCEMAVGGWLVNFLEKSYGYTNGSASNVLVWFFFCFMLARLLFGPIIDRVGFVKSILYLSGLSGALIVIGVLIGEPGVALLAIAGFGVAPIYPTVMALLSTLYAKVIHVAMSFTLIIMGITIVIGNFLVGAITDLFKTIFTNTMGVAEGVAMGYRAGYLFIGICSLICCAGAVVLHQRLKKEAAL